MYVGPSFLDSIARIVEARRPYYICIYTYYIYRERRRRRDCIFIQAAWNASDRAPITSPTAILSIDRFAVSFFEPDYHRSSGDSHRLEKAMLVPHTEEGHTLRRSNRIGYTSCVPQLSKQ